MAHVSSFLPHPFVFPEWRSRRRVAPAAAAALPEPSHPACAARLSGFVGSLWRVCDSFIGGTESGQRLRFCCAVTGEPPAPLLETLVRLATFLVSDAASACAGDVTTGRIGILVERRPGGVVLSVEHDGWSRPPAVIGDRSLGWARRIAEANGGTLFRQIDWDRTVTRVTLPFPGRHST